MQLTTKMRIYSSNGHRLYLNVGERERFRISALKQPIELRLFCLVLLYTGCRISEALKLRHASFQSETESLSIICLKKRRSGVVREVPIPKILFELLGEMQNGNQHLWSWHRSTAWRKVKSVMAAANVVGLQAAPKGLRHGYGINAIQSQVPLNMLCKWLGHSDMRTTAIYATPVGADEVALARRMWT